MDDTTPSPEPASEPLPTLATISIVEARILGCLIEKAATTPEVYPLTLNAAVLACNQKTNREPLMNLEPGAVGHALRQMEDRGLVHVATGSRALRYEHRIERVYTITAHQRALLCVMLLRGPQTLNELFTRCERLTQFPDMDELRHSMDRMIQRTPALALCIGRAPGQREDRYMHLLCGPVAVEAARASSDDESSAVRHDSDLVARVEQLEEQVAKLEAALAQLRGQPEDSDAVD